MTHAVIVDDRCQFSLCLHGGVRQAGGSDALGGRDHVLAQLRRPAAAVRAGARAWRDACHAALALAPHAGCGRLYGAVWLFLRDCLAATGDGRNAQLHLGHFSCPLSGAHRPASAAWHAAGTGAGAFGGCPAAASQPAPRATMGWGDRPGVRGGGSDGLLQRARTGSARGVGSAHGVLFFPGGDAVFPALAVVF